MENCFSSGARPRPRLFQSQPQPHTEVSNAKNPPKICAYNHLKKFKYTVHARAVPDITSGPEVGKIVKIRTAGLLEMEKNPKKILSNFFF